MDAWREWDQKDQCAVIATLESEVGGQGEEELAGAIREGVEVMNVVVSRERGAEALPRRRLVVDPDAIDVGLRLASEHCCVDRADRDSISNDEES